MKRSFLITASVVTTMLVTSVTSFAQDKKPESPREHVTGKVAGATINIDYGSPAVKGRKIWGELVPYNEVWRTGANDATTFETDHDITVEGQKLPAGKYSFFAIPTETEWTIIFNKTVKQWGAFTYMKKDDAIRVFVKPAKRTTLQERLIYTINSNGIVLSWENLDVPVSIK